MLKINGHLISHQRHIGSSETKGLSCVVKTLSERYYTSCVACYIVTAATIIAVDVLATESSKVGIHCR